MNHIKKLQKQNDVMYKGFYSLLKYVNSEKFSQDIMVNKNDINLRIHEILNEYDDVE